MGDFNEKGAKGHVTKGKQGNPNFKNGSPNLYVKGKKRNKHNQPNNSMAQEDNNTSGNGTVSEIDMNSDKVAKVDIPFSGEREIKDYGMANNNQAGNNDAAATNTDNAADNNTQNSNQQPNNNANTQTAEADLGQPNVNNGGGPAANNQPAAQPAEPEKTEAEKLSEAEQLVDTFLDGYDQLHGLARYMAKVDMNELVRHHATNKINLNLELPLGESSVKIGQWFTDYNKGIDEDLVLSEKFRDDFKPPAVRICYKRGWGLSDELRIMTLLGKDIVSKGAVVFGLKKSANELLQVAYSIQKQLAGGNTTTNKTPNSDTETQNNTNPEQKPDLNSNPGDDWREPNPDGSN